jgi:hypothetical protein
LTLITVDQNGGVSARSAPVTIHVPYDNDGNGIPDWWELKYLGSTGVLATGDQDGDGVDNITEYQNNTNPNKPPPILTITTPTGASIVP